LGHFGRGMRERRWERLGGVGGCGEGSEGEDHHSAIGCAKLV